MIRASLASIPARESTLSRTVASLLPQVDRLGVYLNGYDHVPAFLADPRIDVARSQEYGDRGDAGKFFWSAAGDFDYQLACDDDLLYPADYAARMVAACARYGGKALVGLHGARLRANPADYHHSIARRFRCLEAVEGEHAVHVLGTGVMCWHRSLPITPDIFRAPNMADIWLSAWANERDIPRLVIGHREGWLQAQKTTGGTIWDASTSKHRGPMNTHELQAKVARETPWRLSQPPRPSAVVSIVTYDREQALLYLLADVERERAAFDGDLEVRIYDDASPGYDAVRDLCRERGYAYFRAPRHYGKADHWRLITQELADLRAVPADWYVFLPDDVRLCEDFFARATAVWETLDEPTALNLAHHLGRSGPAWTRQKPRECGEGVENGWVDGLYICQRDLLERVGFRVPVASEDDIKRWLVRSRNHSSGVGGFMSQALIDSGARLYRVKRSLVVMQDVPSRMHPELRKSEPLTAVDPAEPFVRYPVGKARIVADPADHVGQYAAAGAWYEQDVLEVVKAAKASGLYIDVGAHIGNHTAFFATECGAQVLAIEPDAANYARLVATVAASEIGARVRTLNAAVHPTWRTARPLPAPPGNSGMARVSDGGESGPVAVVRLDEVVDGQPVGLVKIDVEGDVLGVLESARHIIARDHPLIVAEAGEQREAVSAMLGGLGYGRPHGPYGETPVSVWTPAKSAEPLLARSGKKKCAVRLSAAMMAHPKRAASVERMRAALDRDVPVVWDEKDDRWDTGRRAWLAYDHEATHHVVLQDDLLVCRDLLAGLEKALACVPPTVPVIGYVGRGRPYRTLVEHAVAAAGKRHISWYTMQSLCWGPLVVCPTAVIEEMIAHCDTLTQVENYDRRLSRYWETVRETRTWCTRPSLVDHADGPSLIPGRRTTDHAQATSANRIAWDFIGEDASALDVDWSGDVLEIGRPVMFEHRPARQHREHKPTFVRR